VRLLARLERADSTDLEDLQNFLRANSLPTVGLEDCYENFFIAIDDEGRWAGVAGYEAYNQSALLRSVAVDKALRGQGYGRALVEAVLQDARKRGVRTMYLLTETAGAYFQLLGFESIDRNRIEQAVQRSPEFTECCRSAQGMRKVL
jgi:N-acetylglutamate synthase-like GNAT family acetyltransferase